MTSRSKSAPPRPSTLVQPPSSLGTLQAIFRAESLMHSLDITSAVLALFVMALILAIAEFATRTVRHTTTANDAPTGKIKAHLDAKLSSKGLADLVVQALVDSKLVAADKAHEAVEIAARKIDLRKAL